MIRDLALLAARLAIGGGIAAHGAQKAFGSFEGSGPAGAAGLMDSLGFRPGPTFATAASSTEIAAGALIALGLGGPIGPALLGSTMIVAGSSVHWKNGFFAQKNGIELSTLYAAAGLAFAGGGYGALSLDAALDIDALRSQTFTALALSAGILGAIAILAARTADAAPPDPAHAQREPAAA